MCPLLESVPIHTALRIEGSRPVYVQSPFTLSEKPITYVFSATLIFRICRL